MVLDMFIFSVGMSFPCVPSMRTWAICYLFYCCMDFGNRLVIDLFVCFSNSLVTNIWNVSSRELLPIYCGTHFSYNYGTPHCFWTCYVCFRHDNGLFFRLHKFVDTWIASCMFLLCFKWFISYSSLLINCFHFYLPPWTSWVIAI